jgi:L-amino acid N-acyltransferase YncA
MSVPASLALAIEPLRAEHWEAVARIYAEGIATGDATLETEVPDWAAWDESHLPDQRFVAMHDGRVVGWVAATPVSGLCVFGGVVEDSVYVAAEVRGTGVGRKLLDHLVASTERAGIWTIEAGILPENEASIRVHERAGFELVGRRKRLGNLNGIWRDVLLLERRSSVVE